MAEKPKRALLPVPAFSEYEQALRAVGCEIEYYYTNEKDFFCIDNSFLSRITEETDILFLCSPSNPSGHAIEKDKLVRIAERCEALRVRMVLDECFIDFSSGFGQLFYARHGRTVQTALPCPGPLRRFMLCPDSD